MAAQPLSSLDFDGWLFGDEARAAELGSVDPLDRSQLRELFEFRAALRRYLRWSEEQAELAGLTAARHQLLLAVASHEDPAGPTISEVADYLLLRHHSAVGLVDRAAQASLVERVDDRHRHRLVRVRLTPLGRKRLEGMDRVHREELGRLRHTFELLGDALPKSERP